MHIPDRLDTAPAHYAGSEVLVLEEDGTFTARGRIEESDATKGIHKIRNDKGHIVTAKMSRTFSVPEAEAIVESNRDIPDPVKPETEESDIPADYENRYKYFAIVAATLLAIACAYFVLTIGHSEEPKPTASTGSVAPRSEVQILTEELNALNLRRAPLIESCASLKSTESEIKLRTDRLYEIRSK